MYETLKDFLTDDFWIMPATPKYIDKGVPYITSKNIKNGKIDYNNINYISKEDYENISKNRPIKVNDILISMIGTIGETAVVTKADGDFYGQNMFLVRLNDKKINQRFFLNYFKSSFVKNQLFNKQNKSTQSYLKANHIEDLKVPVISIEEQIKIADKLDKIQMMIDEKKEQISLLNQLIKSQFVEMFGDIESNSNNYKIVELSEISDYWNGLTYKPSNIVDKDGTIVLRSSNIQESKIDYKDIVRIDCNIGEKKFVNENDILMCSRNGSSRLVGKVALIPRTDEKMSFGAFMMIIRSKYYPYLFTYFQTNAFRKQISTGATTTINQITTNMMNKVKLPLPSEQDIEKFNILLKQIDKQKFEFEKSLKKLEELQASLMQEYFG
ncbi:MAG: hypothetical protein E7162_07200 [Firmicutes bacterium]|nr:hypothetical protein [Bacillota bacterium]